MKVFKFGGASVKDADSVKNIGEIIRACDGNLVVVVSAMGEMTNLFEELVRHYFRNEEGKWQIFKQAKSFHLNICIELFGSEERVPGKINSLFRELEAHLQEPPSRHYDYEYDQLICYGELLSTTIISCYLNETGIANNWVDIRTCLKTDDTYREAKVNWDDTNLLVSESFNFVDTNLYLTQGFIGSTIENSSTSLGREGSDFTGAIIANVLDAEYLAIWKDVPGVLNADPKLLPATQMLNELSYREAIEMSHSGAKIIHPKTIKPLQNKNIPLYVRSFLDPGSEGTVIHNVDYILELMPVYIIKQNQVLITLSPVDFSFVGIGHAAKVLKHFTGIHVRVNLFQLSAIDLNLVVDMPENGIENIIKELAKTYEVKYNSGLEMVTIRYYTDEVIAGYTKGRRVYIEQTTRRTARIVLK
ncbi:MAG: aspartate kinase [Chlorobi bacterium]|nr:aspartate kinase [Chlorobiota bacterium]